METSYLIVLENINLIPEAVNQVTRHAAFHDLAMEQVNSKKHRLSTSNTLDGQSLFIFCWAN
jgi:hypothetical protein